MHSNNVSPSPVDGVEASEVLVWEFQGLERHKRVPLTASHTVWDPFLILLLSPRPALRTRAVSDEIKLPDFLHAVAVHAPLRKEILAIPSVLPSDPISLPGYLFGVAVVQVLEKDQGRCFRHDLQAPKETKHNALAMLNVEPGLRHWLVLQSSSQTCWHEQSVWVCLYNPLFCGKPTLWVLLVNLFPHLTKKRCVDPLIASPSACLRPS
mmetsp:Transcript_60574/g.120015  ORF Transcript_60574/g.120015 Transcript_60574/m.120015 type:complete len:209 (-) Transcript_60574:714-1340(-)